MTCIYCGEPLPVTTATLGDQVPAFAPVEELELGYSIILAPLDTHMPTERQVGRLSEITKLEEKLALAALDARVSVPVLRVHTIEEADMATRFLAEADLGATIVADADLRLRTMSRRVREVRFGADEIDLHVMFGDWVTVTRDDIRLMVEARIVSTQFEILEGQGKKAGEFDPLESKQFFIENYAIDLYCGGIDESFRISADRFDFSCLGAEMSHRIDLNITALGRTIQRFAGASRCDQNYARIARVVEHVWPASASVNSFGIRARGDFRKYKRSLVSTDALAQFTRYSRAMFVLRQQ